MSITTPFGDFDAASVVEAGDLLIITLPESPQAVAFAQQMSDLLGQYLPPSAQVLFIPGGSAVVVKKGSTA